MRIGQFTDSFYPIVDGVGRVVYNYARALPAMGDECYVVAPMTDTGYRGGYPFELIDYTGMPLPGSPQYKAGLAVLDRHYYERIEAVTLDIAHAHTPFFSGQEALRLAAKHDVPLVGTFHSKYYDDFYKLTRAELLASIGVRFVVEFYERCDEVWAVSKTSASALRDYGFKGEIVVMENGAELRPVNPEDAPRRRATGSTSAIRCCCTSASSTGKRTYCSYRGRGAAQASGQALFRGARRTGPDEEAIRRKSRSSARRKRRPTGHVRYRSARRAYQRVAVRLPLALRHVLARRARGGRHGNAQRARAAALPPSPCGTGSTAFVQARGGGFRRGRRREHGG